MWWSSRQSGRSVRTRNTHERKANKREIKKTSNISHNVKYHNTVNNHLIRIVVCCLLLHSQTCKSMYSYTQVCARGCLKAHSKLFHMVTTITEILRESDAMPWGNLTMNFNFPPFHPAISLFLLPPLYFAALYLSSSTFSSFSNLFNFIVLPNTIFSLLVAMTKLENNAFYLTTCSYPRLHLGFIWLNLLYIMP